MVMLSHNGTHSFLKVGTCLHLTEFYMEKVTPFMVTNTGLFEIIHTGLPLNAHAKE